MTRLQKELWDYIARLRRRIDDMQAANARCPMNAQYTAVVCALADVYRQTIDELIDLLQPVPAPIDRTHTHSLPKPGMLREGRHPQGEPVDCASQVTGQSAPRQEGDQASLEKAVSGPELDHPCQPTPPTRQLQGLNMIKASDFKAHPLS